jgi:hypothetical protein
MRILTALLMAAASTFCAASIKDCDTTSVFRVTELAVTPDPPVRGQSVTMTVRFDNPGPVIDAGTVTTSVTLNGIPFQPSTEALCTNTACPIPSGGADRSTTSTWPTNVGGRVVTKSQWTSESGASLLCVQTSLSVAVGKHLRQQLNRTTELNSTIADLWHDDLSAKTVVPWIPDSPMCLKKRYANQSITDVLFL